MSAREERIKDGRYLDDGYWSKSVERIVRIREASPHQDGKM